MNKDIIDSLSQSCGIASWQIAIDAATSWGLAYDQREEAYEIFQIWRGVQEAALDEKQWFVNRNRVREHMKAMGYPVFETYQETAAFILEAVYGKDD